MCRLRVKYTSAVSLKFNKNILTPGESVGGLTKAFRTRVPVVLSRHRWRIIVVVVVSLVDLAAREVQILHTRKPHQPGPYPYHHVSSL